MATWGTWPRAIWSSAVSSPHSRRTSWLTGGGRLGSGLGGGHRLLRRRRPLGWGRRLQGQHHLGGGRGGKVWGGDGGQV